MRAINQRKPHNIVPATAASDKSWIHLEKNMSRIH
jgi:hypothetical protein